MRLAKAPIFTGRDVYAVRPGIIKLYGTGEFRLDWRNTSDDSMEILWPGDREDFQLESAASVEAQPWSLVTEPTDRVEELNATRILRSASERVFRLSTMEDGN